MSTIKNRIKELRLEKGLSQKALAEKVGISNQSISSYEKGIRKPKIEVWKNLADFFNVPITYIQGISNVSNVNAFNDFEKFMDTINVSKDPNMYKVPTNETQAFIEEDSIARFYAMFSLIQSGANLKNLDRGLSKITSAQQMSQVETSAESMFELTLNAVTGDERAKKAYKDVSKTINHYFELNKYDEDFEEPIHLVKTSQNKSNKPSKNNKK